MADDDVRKIHACIEYPLGDRLPSFGAELTAKRWANGSTLRVRFLDGDSDQRAMVQRYAPVWSDYANITFAFGDDPAAEVRVSFNQEGSWSTIGVDALDVPDDQPTMNFGWLRADTDDLEASRVVTHEFGHALGLIHEHSSPAQGIHWDKPVVYRYYMGSPNFWTQEQVDSNVFQTYGKDQTQYTETDPLSIMMYPIPEGFTVDGLVVGFNNELSDVDKTFIARIYPKA